MNTDVVGWLAPLLESAETAIVGVDLCGNVVFWSAGAEALFGWSERDVLGQPLPIVPPVLRQEWQLQMQRVIDLGQSTPAAETQRTTRDGRPITVLRASSPVRGTDGRVSGLLDLLIDATALKQLDEESRALAQVRERELVAMDLHDGLIQSLYAVVLNLAAQERALGDAPPSALEAVRAARREVERVIAETRSYVFNLRSRAFTPRNLESGLRLLVDSLRLNAGVDVSLDFDRTVEPLLQPEVRGHLLYLVREAVSNVLRHADAKHVRIQLAHLPEAVVLTIEDDGVGFVNEARMGERHHGLRNMAERARLIGGRLQVKTAPGEGTQLHLELAL